MLSESEKENSYTGAYNHQLLLHMLLIQGICYPPTILSISFPIFTSLKPKLNMITATGSSCGHWCYFSTSCTSLKIALSPRPRSGEQHEGPRNSSPLQAFSGAETALPMSVSVQERVQGNKSSWSLYTANQI